MAPIDVPVPAHDGLPKPEVYLLTFGSRGHSVQTHRIDSPRMVDANGVRTHDSDAPAVIFDRLAEARAAGHPYTDVFVISHGWLTDTDAAIEDYAKWVELAIGQRARHRLAADYHGMVVCVHWPSDPRDTGYPVRRAVHYAGWWLEKKLPFLSFYRMKDRAFRIGRNGLGPILRRLTAEYADARIHVMGHSFGAIVTSNAIAQAGVSVDSLFLIEGAMSTWSFADPVAQGPRGAKAAKSKASEAVERAIDRVTGVVVGSSSSHDRALSIWYPLAESTRSVFWWTRNREPAWGGFGRDRYGALGFRGVSGMLNGAPAQRRAVPHGTLDMDYELERGAIYSIDGSAVVTPPTGKGSWWTAKLMGAHSQILKPEISNLYWQAAGFPLIGAAAEPSEAPMSATG
ncbi:hypothetical protein [Gryllotalpicola koreensis]|uniref:Alpha/beta hydrolase n=1 Tax=Gryllotalpicola koreensis TaxID=993086 RepID=A0ABP8A3H9_9MICO